VAAEVVALTCSHTRFQRLRAAAVAVSAVLCSLGCAATASAQTAPPEPRESSGLAGQLLVATPSIGDPRFAGTVIFMVRHDHRGAFGLIVNRAVGRAAATKLLEANGIAAEGQGSIRLHYGGPVQRETGWVVHTPDRRVEGSIVVSPSVAVTSDPALLKEIAAGRGPRRHFIAFGYAGWSAGQLEGEIRQRAWVPAPADEQTIYDDDMDSKWSRAMERRGIPL
jgi:putative transcriptional regulator